MLERKLHENKRKLSYVVSFCLSQYANCTPARWFYFVPRERTLQTTTQTTFKQIWEETFLSKALQKKKNDKEDDM